MKIDVNFKKLKRYISIIVFAGLGFTLLWYLTSNQDVERIWFELKNANFYWIGLSLLAGFISQLLRAMRWKLIIDSMGLNVRFSDTFYAMMLGYVTNLLVPRLGEITRCGALSKSSNIPFNKTVGTMVAERGFDMLSLILIVLATILLQYQLLKNFLNEILIAPALIIINDYFWFLLALAVISLLLGIFGIMYLKRVDAQQNTTTSKIKRQLQGFISGLLSLTQIKKPFTFLFQTILIWFFYFLTVYLCFFAISATSVLGVLDGFTLLALGSLGIVAPVPGGIGTYHFIAIKTLSELMGIATEPATSYAYLAHASQTFLIIALGVFSYFMISLRIKNKIRFSNISSTKETL